MTAKQDGGHTPGPWHVGEGSAARIVYDQRGWPIADAKLFHGNRRDGEGLANARLIAAAPETVSALAAVLDDLEHALPTLRAAGWQTHNEEATIRRSRAAIARAEGKRP